MNFERNLAWGTGFGQVGELNLDCGVSCCWDGVVADVAAAYVAAADAVVVAAASVNETAVATAATAAAVDPALDHPNYPNFLDLQDRLVLA